MSLCRPCHQFLRRTQISVTNKNGIKLSIRSINSSRSLRESNQNVTTTASKAPALRPRAEIAAERKRKANFKQTQNVKDHFKPYTEEELDALKQFYTPEQMEALKAAEESIDIEDLAEQWGARVDQWKVDYMDDLSRVDPFVDKKFHLELSDAPQMELRKETIKHEDDDPIDEEEEEEEQHRTAYDTHLEQNAQFKGLSLVEMLYLIEKRQFLPDKIKAGLRSLHQYKDTHREHAAKKILWRFLPKQSTAQRETLQSIVMDPSTGKMSIAFLFQLLDAIPDDKIDLAKKYQLLAMKHWAGTPKEESLRPQLMRTLYEHGASSPSIIASALQFRFKELHIKELGFDPTDPDGNDYMFIQGTDPALYDRDIFYNAVSTPIPRIRDPRANYAAESSEDARISALNRLARTLGVEVSYLRSMRVRSLVQHRVVNQTRNGKIDKVYSLSIAGNGDGLLGVGEGKSAEFEDSRLQSYINALRNLKPIHRYERRTVYGKLQSKSGGTTVELDARPPGFGLRTQSLIFEIARCAGLRDLSARVGRSRNKMNTVKATVQALYNQVLPEDVARARGQKMVDVRKVYYGTVVY